MAYHNELGRWGEDVAASYLRQLGYTILHRDWDYRHRDLDIVAVDNGVLVIAEVTRPSHHRKCDRSPSQPMPMSNSTASVSTSVSTSSPSWDSLQEQARYAM